MEQKKIDFILRWLMEFGTDWITDRERMHKYWEQEKIGDCGQWDFVRGSHDKRPTRMQTFSFGTTLMINLRHYPNRAWRISPEAIKLVEKVK